jgi:hypothetical protein
LKGLLSSLKKPSSHLKKLHIYLWRKVICFVLFCSYEIHWTSMLQIVFLVSLESSWGGGVHGLGRSMKFGLAVQKLLNIQWFLHWNLN